MRDRVQLPDQQNYVKVYVLYGNDNEYTWMGNGNLEIATDADAFQFQHYIEVTNPENQDIFLRSRLQSSNVYERQKNTVITWSDPEQEIQNYIGISFENDVACDMFWRLLCSKIGKNYLEINGREKLDMPSEKNVKMLLEKIKTSYNLVAYHVINSVDFMRAFWETLVKLNCKEQSIKGITVLRELLSHFDPKIMAIFLSDPHYQKFLQIYEFESKINFRECYNKTKGANEIVQITQIARKRILLALRANFVKQFVIDHSKDIMMANMLNQVAKQNEIEALINMLNQKSIEKIVETYVASKGRQKQARDQTVKRIIAFFLECVWVLRLHHADNTKTMFISSFYSSGMLRILAQMMNQGHYKPLEILGCLAMLDHNTFLTEFTNDYRNDSGNSIMRIIGKQFAVDPRQQFADQTISFLKNLAPTLQANKTMFEFFSKTTIYTIFACCKFPERILPLIIVSICDLGATKQIFEYLVKFKYFDVIVAKIDKKELAKKDFLKVIKIVRLTMEQNKTESNETVRMANNELIRSRIFATCLQHFKGNAQSNNLTISCLLESMIFLSKMKFNQLTKTVQDFEWGNMQAEQQGTLRKLIQKIKLIEDEEKKQEMLVAEAELGRKKVHKQVLEEEEQEYYLQQEDKGDKEDEKAVEEFKSNKTRDEEMEASMKKLMEIKSQLGSKEAEEENKMKQEIRDRSNMLKAQKKADDSIEFNFQGLDSQ